jgi:hypothetical protein
MNTQEMLYHFRQQHDWDRQPQHHIKPPPEIGDHHLMVLVAIHFYAD